MKIKLINDCKIINFLDKKTKIDWEWLGSPPDWWFGVFIKKKLIGYGGLRPINEEILYSGPTFINEEYRGNGLQKKLIKEWESIADAQRFFNSKSIETSLRRKNKKKKNVTALGYIWEYK
jgi:hypothetical protein